MAKPLKTFIIYARKDATFKDELTLQLQPLVRKNLIEKWDDSHLLPGEEWEKRILQELASSDLVIMLVSAHSLFSDFIQKKELKEAIKQRYAGVTRVIPILVRDCLWEEEEELAMLQMLPKAPNGNVFPVAAWGDRHSAWAAACRELIKLVADIGAKIEAHAAIELRNAAENAAAKEQAALAAAQAAAEAARQKAEAEKAKKNTQRLQQQDEAAWQTTLAEVAATDDVAEKIAVFEAYLDVETHVLHIEDADAQIILLKAEQHRLRIVAKKTEDARRLAAEKEAARLAAMEAEKKRRPKNGDTLRDAPDLPEMVFVEGGSFQMGRQVTLSDYYIGKYQVTFEEYDVFCTETKREKPKDESWGRGKRPVINVNYEDATAYCTWVAQKTGKKYRLPTEAEWEFAARGGTLSKGFEFAGSNNLDEVGWFWENSGDKKLTGEWEYKRLTANKCKTHPVGEKKANELGLFDMSGNVWEWCRDWYGVYPSEDQLNPTGPESGAYRVLRGGCWFNYALLCRVSFPLNFTPAYRSDDIGFRLVLFTLPVSG